MRLTRMEPLLPESVNKRVEGKTNQVRFINGR